MHITVSHKVIVSQAPALTEDDDRNRMIAEDVQSALSMNSGTILILTDRVGHCERLSSIGTY